MCRHGDPRAATRWRTLLAGCALLVVSALCVTIPFGMQHANRNRLADTGTRHATAAAVMDRDTRDRELDEARSYNQRLAAAGQTVLGDNPDPFSGTDDPAYDTDYLHALDMPEDGIMATIRYPSLGISLPVRHGTGTDTLSRGAGHLYGTSLPVGGTDTHTVISAHTGLADTLMFDKLHSLGGRARVGDVFYLTVLDRTLAYKVTGIQVVDPDDFDALTIQPGKDMATLLTCTPYGVNNKRLLVTGERAAMPAQAPLPAQAPEDRTWLWVWAPIAALWVGVLTIIAVSLARHGRRRPPHLHQRRPRHEPAPDTLEFRIIQPETSLP
ncbi:class C sortase [Bifidobacterium castoris]|uniref:Sortase n=1 Tax=Bifidobacterium castoris TaxID=2306972 RepID=A0A430FAC2_9BIFI|nr:class C sortase [Bifidobacterium castoris]RSX49776.1 sortase [Bifidobacterium castoris]